MLSGSLVLLGLGVTRAASALEAEPDGAGEPAASSAFVVMSTDARFLAAMSAQRSNLRRPPGPMSRARGVGSDTLGGSLPALRGPLTQRFRTPGGGCPLSRVASTGCAREAHSVYAVYRL